MRKPTPTTTLVDYLRDVYQPDRVNLREGSIEQIKITLRVFGRHLGRTPTVDDLDEPTISGFLAVYATSVAAATVNSKRKDLLSLWNTAWDKSHTKKAPRRIRRAREDKHQPKAYSLGRMKRILEFAGTMHGTIGRPGKDSWVVERRLWWPAFLLTLYSTAARVGAILTAQTDDCDLEARKLFIHADTQKQHADQTFWLIPEAVDAIRLIYDPARKYLFYWPYGYPYLWQSYQRMILGPLGITPMRRGMDKFQKIRRTTLSHVAAQNEDQAVKLAGHSSPAITRRNYLDPDIVNPQGASMLVPSLTDDPDDDSDGPAILTMADFAG